MKWTIGLNGTGAAPIGTGAIQSVDTKVGLRLSRRERLICLCRTEDVADRLSCPASRTKVSFFFANNQFSSKLRNGMSCSMFGMCEMACLVCTNLSSLTPQTCIRKKRVGVTWCHHYHLRSSTDVIDFSQLAQSARHPVISLIAL